MNNEIKNIGRFEIWGEWTPELLPAIVPLLEKYEFLLPPWCGKAHVCFWADMEADADCDIDFPYRCIRFRLGPKLFKLTEPEREAQFLHEMMHGYAHQLHNVSYDLLGDALSENPTALTMARKQLRETNEGITCDLTRLVASLLKN